MNPFSKHKLHHFAKYFLIFLFFFILFLTIQLTSPNLIGQDDAFRHIVYAEHYWNNKKITFPIFTTFNKRPVDLYYLYHLALSPFTFLSNGENHQALILGTKLFHSILNGLIFAVFALMLNCLLSEELKKIKELEKFSYLFLAGLYLFTASSVFIFRMLLPRPYLVSILLVMLAVYCLIRKKFLWLFVLTILCSLSYSVPFLMLIPPGIYAFSDLLYNKKKLKNLKLYLPVALTVAALLLAIIIHPKALNYLYNAYFGMISLIFARFAKSGDIQLGGEMYSINATMKDWIWLLPFLFIAVHYLFQITSGRDWRKKVSFDQFFLLLLTAFFFILTIAISRTADFLVPFAIILTTTAVSKGIIPKLREINRMDVLNIKLTPSPFKKKLPTGIYNGVADISKYFVYQLRRPAFQRRLLAVFSGIFILYFIFNIAYPISELAQADPYDKFKKAAGFLKKNSTKKDIIFNSSWDDYPRLFFWNSAGKYSFGIDPVFTYLSDEKMYWLWKNISEKGKACFKKTCETNESLELDNAIKNIFKARFIFLENKKFGKNKTARYKNLIEALDKNDIFKKVFQDQDYPEILIYQVL
jgi:hypothetical protein